MPPFDEAVLHQASSVLRGPSLLADNVVDTRPDRFIAGSCEHLFLGVAMNDRFLRGPKPRSDQSTVGTEHQRGGETAPVSNASGGKKENARRSLHDHIGDCRNERHGRARRESVATCLRALCDKNVRADIDRPLGMLERMHLTDQRDAGLLHFRGIWRRIRERQHDRFLVPLQSEIEQTRIVRQRPGDESTADVRPAHLCGLFFEPGAVGITAAKKAQSTCRGNRGGQLAAGGRIHRRQHDRVLEPKKFGQSRPDSHVSSTS